MHIKQNYRKIVYEISKLIKSIWFIWVPSHYGLNGNDNGKLVINSINYSKYYNYTLGKIRSLLKTYITIYVMSQWQYRWSSSIAWRHSHKIKPRENGNMVFTKLRLDHCHCRSIGKHTAWLYCFGTEDRAISLN